MNTRCHLFFETLATKLKVDIVIALKEKSLSVNELSDQLGQERSKVSHALKTLLDCGFVEFEKSGRKRIYSLNKDTVLPLLDLVKEHVGRYCKVCKKKSRNKLTDAV